MKVKYISVFCPLQPGLNLLGKKLWKIVVILLKAAETVFMAVILPTNILAKRPKQYKEVNVGFFESTNSL